MLEPRKPDFERFTSGPPPLRIHHLLAWMTVTALLISGCLWFDRTMRNGPAIQSRIISNSLMLGAIVIAGALTFAGFGRYWRNGLYPFPEQPGEYLLKLIALASLAMVAAILGIFVSFSFSHKSLEIYYPVAGIVLFIFWIRMCDQGARRCVESTAWRWVFISLCITLILSCLVQSALPLIGFAMCLLWACGDDLRRKTPRGWLHWLGAILSLAITCSAIGTFDLESILR